MTTARTDSFEGLHVLLVTEDDARAQAIAKSLRERKAHVGDVRAGAKDPVALRGADLLVIDARRASATEARVSEVRSDVRARWASVATIDYTTLASGDGTVDLRALEGIVSRLAGMDKALTERARKESSFETMLAPLGPTRTLRALALAGPTLHVELTDGTLHASVDLADELLVAAFAERDGQRSEAWIALARVLGMTDATVKVERRAHPAAMNIMEPVDQALENAAQERARAPEVFASEERSEELSGLRRELRERDAAALAEPLPAQAQSAPASGAKQMPARARTLIGVAPTLAQPSPVAQPSTPSVRPSGARPSMPGRDRFADVPTDPAAPGLLQRMAQEPANDALVPELRNVPEVSGAAPIPTPLVPGMAKGTSAGADVSSPVLSVSMPSKASGQHDGDDEFDDDSDDEYDAGEVTVVADASQLDILRETLGRLEAPEGKKPLTSTMPAPPGPATGELENVATADDPVLELSSPAKSAAESVFGREDELPFESQPPAPAAPGPEAASTVEAAPAAETKAAATPSQPTNTAVAAPIAKRGSEQKSSLVWWIAAALVVLAVVAFALFGGRGAREGATKSGPKAHASER